MGWKELFKGKLAYVGPAWPLVEVWGKCTIKIAIKFNVPVIFTLIHDGQQSLKQMGND